MKIVIRRVGGLEVRDAIQCERLSVIRRVGGLEALKNGGVVIQNVIRRVGGLEVHNAVSYL